MSDQADPLLAVEGLTIRHGGRTLVSRVSFTVSAGEALGLLGASGSGKSLSLRALIGLAPPELTVTGRMRHGGREYDLADAGGLRSVRGSGLGLLFQNPGTAFNPARTIGDQLRETLRVHRPGLSRAEYRAQSLAGLTEVGLSAEFDPRFPHELSGGQQQRAYLALALAPAPRVLLTDEPTTALDPPSESLVLDVIDAARRRAGSAWVLVSHDLARIAERCERLVVLDGGRVVEVGPTERILSSPEQPVTQALVAAIPRRP